MATYNVKITEKRGHKSIWIEGERLADCGFEYNKKIKIVYDFDNNTITITLNDKGTRKVSGRKGRSKLDKRRTEFTPILDLTSNDVDAVLRNKKTGQYVIATIFKGRIKITME